MQIQESTYLHYNALKLSKVYTYEQLSYSVKYYVQNINK
jgi:hypothetical protein